MSSVSDAAARSNYGIPKRPPASTALWAHLLRKDNLDPPPNAGITVPPLTPLDKTGTSMRILLHDTQANFEKFSARVDKMIGGVDEAKREIAMVNTLFQRERETLTGDMIDLVNRSQTEIQKAIGIPAEAAKLEELTKDVDRRLEGLDKRLDAVQMFNQVHSQTLQTQVQALQSLQDQQMTIVAALAPLLPLLQSMPLHIESAKNSIKDEFAKFLEKSNLGAPYRKNRPEILPSSTIKTSKRPLSSLITDGLSSSESPSSDNANKRPRFEYESTAHGTSDPAKLQMDITSSMDTPQGQQSSLVPTPQPSRYLSLQSRQQPPHIHRNNSFAIPNPKTPRRPLSELFPSNGHQNTTQEFRKTPVESTLKGGLAQDPSSRAHFFGLTPSTKRPPRMLRVHSLISNNATVLPTAPPTSGSSASKTENQPEHKDPFLSPNPAVQLPSRPQSATPSVHSPSHVTALTTGLSMLTAKTPQQSPTRSMAVPSPLLPTRPSSRERSAAPNSTVIPRSLLATSVSKPLGQGNSTVYMRPMLKLASTAMPVSKIRERRSPFREGRRFIPLADSDDDDDDDDDG